MKLLLVALVFSAAVILPATVTLPTADACQPYSWYCALTGHYMYGCGTTVPPPAAQCAVAFLRDLTLP